MKEKGKINDVRFGLKGQYNLAQGNALGWINGDKIVRAKMFCNEPINVRTKRGMSGFPIVDWFNSVRRTIDVLNNVISRTGSRVPLCSQGAVSDRTSRNSALGWDMRGFQPLTKRQ